MSFNVGGRMLLFRLIQRTSHFIPSSTPSLRQTTKCYWQTSIHKKCLLVEHSVHNYIHNG